MELEVFNDICFKTKVPEKTSVNNALHGTGHFAKHSQFLSTKTDLKVEDTQTKSGKNLIVFHSFGYKIDKLLNSTQTCTA